MKSRWALIEYAALTHAQESAVRDLRLDVTGQVGNSVLVDIYGEPFLLGPSGLLRRFTSKPGRRQAPLKDRGDH